MAVGDVAAATMGEDEWYNAFGKHFFCLVGLNIIGVFLSCTQRHLLREVLRFDLGITTDDDFSGLFVFFCPACALTQELVEIKLRKGQVAAAATGAGRDTPVVNPLSGGAGNAEGLGGPYA